MSWNIYHFLPLLPILPVNLIFFTVLPVNLKPSKSSTLIVSNVWWNKNQLWIWYWKNAKICILLGVSHHLGAWYLRRLKAVYCPWLTTSWVRIRPRTVSAGPKTRTSGSRRLTRTIDPNFLKRKPIGKMSFGLIFCQLKTLNEIANLKLKGFRLCFDI
jgi:hypothetical protein